MSELAILLAAAAGASIAAALFELPGFASRARVFARELVEPLVLARAEGYVPTAAERRRLWAAGTALAGLGWLVIAGPGPWLAGVAFAPLAVDRVFESRLRRHGDELERELVPWAVAVADVLEAGGSVRAAVARARAGIADGPGARELRRLRADLDAGESLDGALSGLARRSGSGRVAALTRALLVAEQAGGVAPAALRRFAQASEDSWRNRAEMRSATAQARLTGAIVVAIPLAGLGFAELLGTGIAGSLLADPFARVLLAVSLCFQVVGYLAINRIAGAGR